MDDKRETLVKFRVGLFVLVALAAFLGLVYALGARARLFEARYTIHAEFTEVGGLVEGAPVRLAGVQIGRVSAVTFPPEPGGKVRLQPANSNMQPIVLGPAAVQVQGRVLAVLRKFK